MANESVEVKRTSADTFTYRHLPSGDPARHITVADLACSIVDLKGHASRACAALNFLDDVLTGFAKQEKALSYYQADGLAVICKALADRLLEGTESNHVETSVAEAIDDRRVQAA